MRHLSSNPLNSQETSIVLFYFGSIRVGIMVILTLLFVSFSKTDINAQAQELYQKGLELVNQGGVWNLLDGIDNFEKSIELESNFAPAHASLAISYLDLGGNFNYLSPKKVKSKAIAAANQAIKLDENLASGYLAKALIEVYYTWDWSQAETYFEHALEIAPDDVNVLIQYAQLLSILNREGEAQDLFNEAQLLAPKSTRVNSRLQSHLIRSGKLDIEEAKQETMNKINADPQDPYPHWRMAVWYSREGSHQEAIKHLNIQIPLMKGDIADEVGLLGYNYGRLGQNNKAMEQLSKLDKLVNEDGLHVSPVAKAWIYSGLNKKDKALKFLEKAYKEKAHRMGLGLLVYSFIYEPIANDLRFNKILVGSNLQTVF